MRVRLAPVATLFLAVLLIGAARGAPAPARTVSEAEVHEIAGELRCVVCQNLSVADSPSEMARQMRAIVRERLEAGESPAEVVQYFVDRYGEWILLSPRRSGFTLLVWLAPLVAVALGLAIVGVLVWKWTRRPATTGAALRVDPAMRERIRRETEAEP